MDIKSCTQCNTKKPRTEFYKLSGSKYKESWDCRDSMCIPCRTIYSTQRRRNVKIKAVKYLGGKCFDCNVESYPEIYDFHHRDPSKKDFSISKNSKTFESIRAELNKCDLLCANCHRIRHYSLKNS